MKRKSHIGGGVTRGLVTLLTLLMSLVVLASCQEPNAELPQASISVRVTDATGARTITPEGNVNISHYVISVHNDAENIHQESGYLTKGSMFTVTNVPAGTWYAKVDAYIDRGSDTYIKVASDQSEPKAVAAGSSTVFDLVLDTLDEVVSGDVTITLKMPTALSAESTPFWYQYTITGMTDEEFTYTSTLTQSTTGADGLATITLDADTLGLLQGAYRFEITIQDAESNPTVTRKGVDVMRLINGLEAKGTIDLATYESDQSFDVTITDKIGDILTPSIQDGQALYELNAKTGNSLTVTLTEPLNANETIEWYVDGELDETVSTDNATSGQYTLTFTNGSHSVTAIIRNTGTQMAVGSVSFLVVNTNVGFEETENLFTFELNEDQQSYTVTGLAQEVGQFVMPENGVLEIPATYLGKSVTGIGYQAFYKRTDIAGSVIIPDSVTSIGDSAFGHCSALKDVIIPDSVTSIGLDAFRECYSLTKINLPDSVTSIGVSAFENCEALETIEISDSSQLKSIGEGAFNMCSALTEINIPDSMTSIGDLAFASCDALTSINIPDSVTFIGSRTFYICYALDDIYCEAVSQPEGWDANWFEYCYADVFWGVNKSDYDAIIAGTFNVTTPTIQIEDNTATISCDTSFAHVYYTTNGRTPNTATGTLYTEPFAVEVGTTVKAITYVGNNIYSDHSDEFSLLSPITINIDTSGNVTFESSYDIHYMLLQEQRVVTADELTTDGTIYAGEPIQVETGTTVYAVASLPGLGISNVSSKTFE